MPVRKKIDRITYEFLRSNNVQLNRIYWAVLAGVRYHFTPSFSEACRLLHGLGYCIRTKEPALAFVRVISPDPRGLGPSLRSRLLDRQRRMRRFTQANLQKSGAGALFLGGASMAGRAVRATIDERNTTTQRAPPSLGHRLLVISPEPFVTRMNTPVDTSVKMGPRAYSR